MPGPFFPFFFSEAQALLLRLPRLFLVFFQGRGELEVDLRATTPTTLRPPPTDTIGSRSARQPRRPFLGGAILQHDVTASCQVLPVLRG